MSVTVCIPTYNYGHLIARAISSALEQEHVSEILVLDNASIDSTENVISQFKDSRVRYMRSSVNLGFAGNLKRGFELASREFVIFLCADDFLYPDHIRRTVEMLRKYPEMGFVHTAHDYVDDEGKCLLHKTYKWKSRMSGEEFLNYIKAQWLWGICLSSALIRREDLKNAGGVDTDLRFAADYGMWLNLCLTKEVGYIAEPLAGYRLHSNQSSGIFVPGLKQSVFEKIAAAMRRRKIYLNSLEPAFRKMAFIAFARELPRRRIEGLTVSQAASEIRSWARKDPQSLLSPQVLSLIVFAFVPKFFLKYLQRFYKKARRIS